MDLKRLPSTVSEGCVVTTVGKYLLRRLKEVGLDDIFGVPGDFALAFFNDIMKSDVNYVGTCNELNAAYAADAYARIKGIGALSTTYCVGELSAINGVAGCFAENVPVVCITGCPAAYHYKMRTLLHHTLGDYHIPYRMYESITVAHTMLDNAESAPAEIDRVIYACLEKKKPVYIGICTDVVGMQCRVPIETFAVPQNKNSEPFALEEAALEVLKKLHEARSPIFIPGIEIRRFGLEKDFEELVNKSGLPYATMMLGKAVINEEHPQFIGLYQGDRSREYVRRRVENSDCVVVFGEKLTDFNTGGFSASLDSRSTIMISADMVKVSCHIFQEVYIADILKKLTEMVLRRNPKSKDLDIHPATDGCRHRKSVEFVAVPDKSLTMQRMFDRMSHYIPKDAIVIAETGASLFNAAEMMMPTGVHFIGQTFYGSIGYTIGATLGACIAAPERRVILFVGDGSFQVTCQDMSTMIRYKCKPLIFLVNNDGYTIERVIVDHLYNNIQSWKYSKMPAIMGSEGQSFECKTEGELEKALEKCNSKEFCFVEVHLGRWDCSDSLRRAGETMAKNNKLLTDDDLRMKKIRVEEKGEEKVSKEIDAKEKSVV